MRSFIFPEIPPHASLFILTDIVQKAMTFHMEFVSSFSFGVICSIVWGKDSTCFEMDCQRTLFIYFWKFLYDIYVTKLNISCETTFEVIC